MSKLFDYTATARKLWSQFPLATYLSKQVTFWAVGNMLLGLIMHLQALRIHEMYPRLESGSPEPIIIISLLLGTVYGLIIGMTSYYLEKKLYRGQSLGKVIIISSGVSLLILICLFTFTRFMIIRFGMPGYTDLFQLTDASWTYLFLILLAYYFILTLLINFINHVNKKYGPGVLVPLLLGRYRKPREVERIFMFMDLKSSTTIAERLGHLRYSSLIQDSFMDINHVVSQFNSEIYQYVGDEIVLSWKMNQGVLCFHFFFACMAEFEKRSEYYLEYYGLVPELKAGIHGGVVTAVEIGDIRRDIAYHGDVLNTAARIQGLCNRYNQHLLVSTELLSKINLPETVEIKHLGNVNLKGKNKAIDIVGINLASL